MAHMSFKWCTCLWYLTNWHNYMLLTTSWENLFFLITPTKINYSTVFVNGGALETKWNVNKWRCISTLLQRVKNILPYIINGQVLLAKGIRLKISPHLKTPTILSICFTTCPCNLTKGHKIPMSLSGFVTVLLKEIGWKLLSKQIEYFHSVSTVKAHVVHQTFIYSGFVIAFQFYLIQVGTGYKLKRLLLLK